MARYPKQEDGTGYNETRGGERLKAFELYVSAAQMGKRASYRSIGAQLGLDATTIRRWALTDGWTAQVQKSLKTAADTAETTTNMIKRRVRKGFLDGLDELTRIIRDGDSDSDRINAIKTMAGIAMKLEAVLATAGGDAPANQLAQTDFKDELDQPWPSPLSDPQEPPTATVSAVDSPQSNQGATSAPLEASESVREPLDEKLKAKEPEVSSLVLEAKSEGP